MKTMSYQLYSSRNFGPLSETFKMLASIGYAHVEGYGALFADMAGVGQMARDLEEAGLTMPSAHFALDLVERDPDAVIASAKTLGIAHVFVPHIVAELRPVDMAGWQAFGARLQAAGKPLRAAGLSFGWHNHDFEFTPVDGAYPIDAIFDGGPDLTFEYDVAWAARAGADAGSFIDRYADRIMSCHVKDIAPEGDALNEDGWADVGAGVLPWEDHISNLRAAGCALFIAEHDNPSDDKRFATQSFVNFQRM